MTNGNGLLDGTELAKQLKLETLAKNMGARKYLDKYGEALRDGQGGIRPEARQLRESWIPALTDAIKAAVETRDYNGEQYAGPVLNAMPPDRIAAAALGACLSYLMHEPAGVSRTRLAFAVAREVTAELCIDWCKETDRPDGLETFYFDLTKKYRRFRSKNVIEFARRRMESEELFHKKVQIALGGILLTLITECSKFYGEDGQPHYGVQSFREGAKRHTQYITRLHIEVQEHLHEQSQTYAWLSPQWLPSVSPCKKWSKDDIWGGYHTLRYKYVTGTTRNQWKQIEAASKSGQCDELFECMNAGMETSHVLFRELADMQEEVWKSGGNTELGIPKRDLLEQLPRLPEEMANDPERLKDWKLRKSRIHYENIKRKSAIASFRETMAVVHMLADGSRLRFPPQLDFRTRSAPKAQYLSYIQDDVRESLFLFADAKEPGDEGRYWLMAHAAGLYGMDKLSFDERVQWTKDHMHEIARAAALGLDDDWWMKADKGNSPWQFLAACKALVNPEIAARLPVACDGTCNGLQHLSALTRDEHTGRLVNLLPGDRPQDQYADVTPDLAKSIADDIATGTLDARQMERIVAKEAKLREKGKQPEPRRLNMKPDSWFAARAAHWLALEGRSLVKQPVMTVGYAATQDGMATQMASKLKDFGEEEQFAKPIGRYLAMHLIPILRKRLPKPMEVMGWMEVVAKEICSRKTASGKTKPGKTALSWVTDLGFPVIQEYRRVAKSLAFTAIGRIIIEHDDPNANVDLAKQIAGFAANYTHSRDATHKWRTTRRMTKEGHNIWDKHDSFRTHACSRSRLDRVLREEWVCMYAPDVLHQFKAHLERRFEKKLPEPPEYGNLDVTKILESPYAFK